LILISSKSFTLNACIEEPKHLVTIYQDIKEVIKASWQKPNDIKEQYRSASLVGDNKVVFNIHGNKYRLIVKINYFAQVVYIKFIGTHKHYDKIDITKI